MAILAEKNQTVTCLERFERSRLARKAQKLLLAQKSGKHFDNQDRRIVTRYQRRAASLRAIEQGAA